MCTGEVGGGGSTGVQCRCARKSHVRSYTVLLKGSLTFSCEKLHAVRRLDAELFTDL